MRRFLSFMCLAVFVLAPSAYAGGNLRMALMAFPPSKGNPHSELIDYLGTWAGLFDPLTLVTDDGELIPWLATSWEQEGASSWIFSLREGVTYSNGRAFNADAVVEAVKYLTSPEGKSEAVSAALASLESAEALDDRTVRIRTHKPDPLLPYAIQGMRLPEPQAWRTLGREGFANAPVGTGPFVVKAWGTTLITLQAQPSSWRAPYLNSVQLNLVRDPIARLNGLITDQFDVIVGVDTDSFADVEATGATIRRNRVSAAMAIMFNTVDDQRLQDPNVRRALNYAVNKQLIIDVFFNGVTEPATQPAPRMAVGFNRDLEPYPYDPERAQSLLAEAGYADGFSFTTEVNVDSALTERVYQQVASDLSKVGVDMTLRAIPRAQYLNHFMDGEWGGSAFAAGYFTPTMDALETLRGGSCLRTDGWYCDPAIVPQIEAAMAEHILERRTAMVKDLMAHAHDTAHGLFLYEAASFTAFSNKVQGYGTHGSFILYENVKMVP